MALKPRRSVIYLLLLVIAVALVLGYGVGRFSTLEEQVTTTTTNTSTMTETSTVAYISTYTKTKTVTTVPQPLPSPANSLAVVRSQLLLDGSVLLMVSMDKPAYKTGETIHFKGTLTNLTPEEVTLYLVAPGVRVYNSSNRNPQPSDNHKDEPWYYPHIIIGLGPPVEATVTIGAGKTVTLKEFTADWNMTGIHVEHRIFQNGGSAWIAYDDLPVPPGKYYADWGTYIGFSMSNIGDWINQTVTFEITKSPTVNTTQPSGQPPPAGTVKTTTVTVTRTITDILATIVTTTVTTPVTSTSVSTSTLTETLTTTTTNTSAGQASELSLYTWATGSTVAAIVLLIALILRRRN